MAEAPKFAWDYEFHFSSGEPCFLTLSEQDKITEHETHIQVELMDEFENLEGVYTIDSTRLNWKKAVRREVQP